MINPMINAVIAPINTPEADKSLIFIIFSCRAGDMKSAILSIDVLMISKLKTSPIEKTIAIHSIKEILKNTPAVITQIAANKWIRAFCSSLSSFRKPLIAYLKLFILFEIEKLCGFIAGSVPYIRTE